MDIKIPTFPDGIKNAKILALHIKQGDHIQENDLIVEMETDKAILEIVSPSEAYVQNIWIEEGDAVSPEQCITTLNPIENTEHPLQNPKLEAQKHLKTKEKMAYVLVGVCIGIALSIITTLLTQSF